MSHRLPSFYWSVCALWSSPSGGGGSESSGGGKSGKELAGVRLTKHILCQSYSDSLAFDLLQRHAAELGRKAKAAGGGQRNASGALKGVRRLPTKAHLAVGSLPKLLRVYRDYSRGDDGGAPLVPLSDWTAHFARCREGSEPLSQPLSERPSLLWKHSLAPELLLNTRLNEHAVEAGLADGAHLKASSRWRWVLIGESPSDTPLPEQLASLIDETLAARQQRQREEAKEAKKKGKKRKRVV